MQHTHCIGIRGD